MRLFLSTSIATVLLAATSIPLVKGDGYNRIIAFADSYTDNGNDFRASQYPPSPPYWKGRFSNGPTWLEHVGQKLHGVQIINNAHGGATSDNAHSYSEFNGYVVPGVIQQIEQSPVPNPNPEKDLYVVFVGYNDLNAIVNPDYYHIVKPYTYNDVVDSVIKAMNQLIDKYDAKQFTVMTCPPFDQWPVVKPQDKPSAKKLIDDYNTLLGNTVQKIQNITVNVLDDHAWFEDALAHPDRFGLETNNGPCVSASANGNITECSDQHKHFFWDAYHPEAKVHQALGDWATTFLKKTYHFD